MTRLLLPTLVFCMLVGLATSVLRAVDKFKTVVVCNVLGGIFIIAITYFLFFKFKIYSVVIATILVSSYQFLFLMFFLKKSGLRFNKDIVRINNREELVSFFSMLLPFILATSVGQLNGVVDRMFASMLPDGCISALYYGDKGWRSVYSFSIASISIVFFPYFAKDLVNKKWDSVKQNMEYVINSIIIISTFLLVYFFFFRFDIIRLLFERGKFNNTSTVLVGNAFIIYCLALLPHSMNMILGQILMTLRYKKVLIYGAFLSAGTNIILNFFLIKLFGYLGLAISSVFAFIACYVFYSISVKKYFDSYMKISFFNFKYFFISLVSVISLCGFFRIIINITGLHLGIILNILIFCFCVIGHFVILNKLKIKEVTILYDKLSSKLRFLA
jgi:putative peptidoglycan lipid II flippase